MSEILQRIKQYYESEGMSSREFSLSIGRSEGYFSTALKKGSEPTADMLSKIFNTYPSLSIVWVFTSCGNMRNIDENHTEIKTIDEIIEDKIDTKFKKVQEMIEEMGEKLEKKIQLKTLKELQSIKNNSKDD
ncbi:hypothetical protein [Yeosuana marina]|uniref:hypothetical protein n=1 Tax=Yeosuana marina TaxID=1565536 RepID=UPI0030C7CC22